MFMQLIYRQQNYGRYIYVGCAIARAFVSEAFREDGRGRTLKFVNNTRQQQQQHHQQQQLQWEKAEKPLLEVMVTKQSLSFLHRFFMCDHA